jgi:hypothetical protein
MMGMARTVSELVFGTLKNGKGDQRTEYIAQEINRHLRERVLNRLFQSFALDTFQQFEHLIIRKIRTTQKINRRPIRRRHYIIKNHEPPVSLQFYLLPNQLLKQCQKAKLDTTNCEPHQRQRSSGVLSVLEHVVEHLPEICGSEAEGVGVAVDERFGVVHVVHDDVEESHAGYEADEAEEEEGVVPAEGALVDEADIEADEGGKYAYC